MSGFDGAGINAGMGYSQGAICLSHMMKLLERILGGRIRKKVEQELGEEQ